MLFAVIAAVVLGAVMTTGDYVWEVFRLRHRMASGLIHGAAMCMFIGGFVGLRERRPIAGLIGGPLIGVLAAAGFYLLARWMRYSAMFPAWAFFWLCFAFLQDRLNAQRRPVEALARGFTAAILSGLAFWAISGIWIEHSPGGPDYFRHLWSWTVAFLPGFLALFAFRSPVPAPRSHAAQALR